MKMHSADNVAYYNGNRYSSFQELHKIHSMRGAKRVIFFCIMTTVLPTVLIIIPLYLRHVVFADTTYKVADSDVIEISEGISSVFCSSHSLQMNTSFNAFQLNQSPRISSKSKHVRFKKSMTLPDDTLEYWGFYLLKGATVLLKVCSRYEGSRILLVRGERNLQTCGLMEHNQKKLGANMDHEHNQVKVAFESPLQVQDTDYSKIDQDSKKLLITDAAVEDLSDDSFNVDNATQLSRVNRSNKTKENTQVDHKSSKHKHHNRHPYKKFIEKRQELYKLQQELQADEDVKFVVNRPTRDTRHLYDRRIKHGGNAMNFSKFVSNEDSVSSFEADLLTCYSGNILLTKGFPPSHLCTGVHYLEIGKHMETVHDVVSDGYYYYIFYSDNDFISNDIYAIFDIYRPTLKFANISDTKTCYNQTECTFPVSFWSNKTVIVEVPMRNGSDHEGDDFKVLISICHPRMSVYIIFPVTVMFLILGCAFT